jgi:hypothetical protein
MRTNLALLSEENQSASTLRHPVDDVLKAIVNDPGQSQTDLVTARSQMENVQFAVEEARYIHDTLESIHTLVRGQARMDAVSVEALRVAVEALMVRTGLKTRGFSLEGYDQSDERVRLRVATEGLGTFIVDIIKAIVTAIQKVIETILNFFKWLFGSRERASAETASLTKQAEQVQTRVKKMDATTKVLHTQLSEDLQKNTTEVMVKQKQYQEESEKAATQLAQLQAENKPTKDLANELNALRKKFDALSAKKDRLGDRIKAMSESKDIKGQHLDRRMSFYNEKAERLSKGEDVMARAQAYVQLLDLLNKNHFTTGRAGDCYSVVNDIVKTLYADMTQGDYATLAEKIPYLKTDWLGKSDRRSSGMEVFDCDISGNCFVAGNPAMNQQHDTMPYASDAPLADLRDFKQTVERAGVHVSDDEHTEQVRVLKDHLLTAMKSLVRLTYKDAVLIHSPKVDTGVGMDFLGVDAAVEVMALQKRIGGFASDSFVESTTRQLKSLLNDAKSLQSQAEAAKNNHDVRTSDAGLNQITSMCRSIFQVFEVQYVTLYAKLSAQTHAVSEHLKAYARLSTDYSDVALMIIESQQEYDEAMVELERLHAAIGKVQAEQMAHTRKISQRI